MVFFTCDGCGETLKKAQVDKHVMRCRNNCDSVSCVDCSVSFFGDDFRGHTSCISEAERYEKSLYRGKTGSGGKKKKKDPQMEWMELIESCTSSAPPDLVQHMKALSSLDNAPRKEKQFRNFTSNSLRLRNPTLVGRLWEHLAKAREEQRNQRLAKKDEDNSSGVMDKKGNNVAATTSVGGKDKKDGGASNSSPGQTDAVVVPMNKSSDECLPTTDIIGSTDGTTTRVDHKKVGKAMKKVLKRAPKHEMKIKSLRKEVMMHLLSMKDGGEAASKKDVKAAMKKHLQHQACSSDDEGGGGGGGKFRQDGKLVVLISKS